MPSFCMQTRGCLAEATSAHRLSGALPHQTSNLCYSGHLVKCLQSTVSPDVTKMDPWTRSEGTQCALPLSTIHETERDRACAHPTERHLFFLTLQGWVYLNWMDQSCWVWYLQYEATVIQPVLVLKVRHFNSYFSPVDEIEESCVNH